jgi:hypothetical protein
MSKGSMSIAAVTTATVIIVLILLGLALDTGEVVRDKIRIETVNVTAERINSALYMTDALEEARVELDLEEEYGFTEETDGVYLNYTSGAMALSFMGNTGKEKLEAPINFELKDPGVAEEICLIKEGSEVLLSRGGCN